MSKTWNELHPRDWPHPMPLPLLKITEKIFRNQLSKSFLIRCNDKHWLHVDERFDVLQTIKPRNGRHKPPFHLVDRNTIAHSAK